MRFEVWGLMYRGYHEIETLLGMLAVRTRADARHLFRGVGFRVSGVGFGVWGVRFEVWGLGLRVWGLGFRVRGLALRGPGLRCRVWGLLGFRV